MNRKREDQIQRLAFGELSDGERIRLERELASDPEGQKLLSQYRAMQGAMVSLYEIPVDQMSQERLHRRILQADLKARSRWDVGWLWMPATAALIAGVVFFARRGLTEVRTESLVLPSMVATQDASREIESVPLPTHITVPLKAVSPATPEPAVTEQSSTDSGLVEASYTETPRPSRHHHRAKKSRDSFVASQSETVALLASAEPATEVAASTSLKAETKIEKSSVQADENLVLISSSADAETGALQATEQAPGADQIGG